MRWRHNKEFYCLLTITTLILFVAASLAQTPLPVSSAASAPEKIALGILQVVKLAQDNSYATQLAHEKISEAESRATISRARLLPAISGAVSQRTQTVNLAALGFKPNSFPGFSSSLIGPFQTFDARVQLVQSVFDFSALHNYREALADEQLFAVEEKLARQQIAVKAALGYLNFLQAQKSMSAAQADLTLAENLLQLAQDQKQAGVATGVDVTRADNRVAQAQVKLALAQNQMNEARLILLRLIGMNLATELILTDPLSYQIPAPASLDAAITNARTTRLEIQTLEAQIKVKDLKVSATKAERLPSLAVVADVGENGTTPFSNAYATYAVGVQLKVPIFNGGQTQGRIKEAESQRTQIALRLTDVRNEIEQQVRLTWQQVESTAAQVAAAQRALTLAEKEMAMARDRFSAGVANNLEIINAQTALTIARENEILALAQQFAARISLMAAQGKTDAF